MTVTFSIRVINTHTHTCMHTHTHTHTGQVDASKTVFIDQTHVLVVTRGTYHAMTVIPKDSFGNMAIISQEYLTAEIRKVRMYCVASHRSTSLLRCAYTV